MTEPSTADLSSRSVREFFEALEFYDRDVDLDDRPVDLTWLKRVGEECYPIQDSGTVAEACVMDNGHYFMLIDADSRTHDLKLTFDAGHMNGPLIRVWVMRSGDSSVDGFVRTIEVGGPSDG